MPRSLNSPRLSAKVTGTLVNTMTDGSSASAAHPNLSYTKTLTSGVDANQANRAWQLKNNVIASGAQETINIYNFLGYDIGSGEGRDGVGQLITLEEIVMIAIVNENAVDAAGLLEIIPAYSHGWAPIGSHTEATGGALRGQGMLMKVQPGEAGFDVEDNVTDRITLRAVDGAVTYSMYIFGRSDDEASSSSSSSLSSSSKSSSSASSVSSSISTSSVSTSSSSISTSSISTSESSQSPSSVSSSSSSSESSSSLSP